jgi:hypothetical protein
MRRELPPRGIGTQRRPISTPHERSAGAYAGISPGKERGRAQAPLNAYRGVALPLPGCRENLSAVTLKRQQSNLEPALLSRPTKRIVREELGHG